MTAETESRNHIEEDIKEGQLPSPYFEAAIKEVRKKSPKNEQVIRTILEDVDRQGVDNFAQFKSEKYKGVAISYTRVSVTDFVKHAFPQQFEQVQPVQDQISPREKIINVVFMGFVYPPGGSPFTAWDIVTDRAISSMAKVVRPLKDGEQAPDVEVISLGSPNGLGGMVTPEWIEGLKKNGFSQYAEAYAELLKDVLPQDEKQLEKTKIVFQGMSMGGSVAEQTLRNLPNLQKHTQLLLDNPVGIQALSLLQRAQIPIGYFGEAAVGMAFNERIRSAIRNEKEFLKSLRTQLKQKGLDVDDDSKQQSLKKSAALQEALTIIKGTPLDTKHTRMYIRQGIKDPVTTPISELVQIMKDSHQGKKTEKKITSEGRALKMPINSTHSIDRNRVKRWSKIIDYCSSKKGKSPESPQ